MKYRRYRSLAKRLLKNIVFWAVLIIVVAVLIFLILRRRIYVAKPIIQQQPSVEQKPTVIKRIIKQIEVIPYGQTAVDDPNTYVGSKKLVKQGEVGVKTLTYEVSSINGVDQGKVLISEEITHEPVNEIMEYGAKTSEPPVVQGQNTNQ